MRLKRMMRALGANRSGVAMTEFALSLPFLLTAGLFGAETANLALTNMRISQTAMQIADNASRIGDTSTLQNRRIFESDINDLLIGSNIQSGEYLELFERGRVVISSLEMFDPAIHCPPEGCSGATPDEGDQFIHWQRCKGKKAVSSSYGVADQIMPEGMGPDDSKVLAMEGEAIIFVEVTYDYKPLIATQFAPVDTLHATASFIVRDDRDLSQIYQRDIDNPDVVAGCSNYDGYAITAG